MLTHDIMKRLHKMDASLALIECADILVRFVRDYPNPNIKDREFRIELTVQATSALKALAKELGV
jgi:hypothetical protein